MPAISEPIQKSKFFKVLPPCYKVLPLYKELEILSFNLELFL